MGSGLILKLIVRAFALVTGLAVGFILVTGKMTRREYAKNLANRMDTALAIGTYDRGEIGRWRDALDVIGRPLPVMWRESKRLSRDLQK